MIFVDTIDWRKCFNPSIFLITINIVRYNEEIEAEAYQPQKSIFKVKPRLSRLFCWWVPIYHDGFISLTVVSDSQKPEKSDNQSSQVVLYYLVIGLRQSGR